MLSTILKYSIFLAIANSGLTLFLVYGPFFVFANSIISLALIICFIIIILYLAIKDFANSMQSDRKVSYRLKLALCLAVGFLGLILSMFMLAVVVELMHPSSSIFATMIGIFKSRAPMILLLSILVPLSIRVGKYKKETRDDVLDSGFDN